MTAVRPSVRDLFAAARADAPSGEAHERVWESVASATGIAAGTAVVAGGASSGFKAALSAKLLGVLGLVAAAGTAAVVALSLGSVEVAPSSALAPGAPGAAAAGGVPVASARVSRAAERGARLPSAPRALDPAMADRARRAKRGEDEPAAGPSALAPAKAAASSPASDLAAEAKIVTDARAALVAGDPTRALTLVRAARRLPTRALEPEALSLEARILQALGRSDEAAATELELRRRYAGHSLAR